MSHRILSKDYPLVLASKSQRRKDLLNQIGIPFVSVESMLKAKVQWKLPEELAQEKAVLKAMDVWVKCPGHWTLGADTVVALHQRVFGKPSSYEEAEMILMELSGKTHRVITAFALLNPDGALAHREVVITQVEFKDLTREEIRAYARTNEPMDKAGAYAIQGIGTFLVKNITGSYTNVVGLPLFQLIQALKAVGAIKGFP